MIEEITSEEPGSELPPKWGSDRYKQQVDTIVTQFMSSVLEKNHLSSFIMMFILDRSYNRAAICEAEKIIKQERGYDPC